MTKNIDNRRPRRVNHAYRKMFSNIQEGIHEMCLTIPKVKTILFSDVETDPKVNLLSDAQFTKVVLNKILDLFEKSFPCIDNEDYPNTYSLSIRGDMFFFRTKDRISIAWEYDYEQMDKGISAVWMSVIFAEPTNKFLVKREILPIGEKLVELGWQKYDHFTDSRRPRANKQDPVVLQTAEPVTVGETAVIKDSQGNTISTEEFVERTSDNPVSEEAPTSVQVTSDVGESGGFVNVDAPYDSVSITDSPDAAVTIGDISQVNYQA